MTDSGRTGAERAVQLKFSILVFAAATAMVVALLLAHSYFANIPDREELGSRLSEIRLERVAIDSSGFEPLRLVGAWKATSEDPRVGGISGLAFDDEELLAVTDSGAVIRIPKPGGSRVPAQIRELPGGPGDPGFKSNRDSEAIARDPSGRGWWVAFENEDELWLYDELFARPLVRVTIPSAGLSFNKGIEGLTSSGSALLALPEAGGRILRFDEGRWSEIPFSFPARRVSAAAALSANSLLVVERGPRLLGFANALVRLDRCRRGYCPAWRKPLPLGRFDNVEGLAIEQRPSGATRLWLVTDDNMRGPFRTLLLAVDLPPSR